jgi:RNA polymerase sigma factor (sigma-70 family)
MVVTTVVADLRRWVTRVFPALDADEIVQSTMLRLLGRSRRLAPEEIASAWGYVVTAARFAALDAIRARGRRTELPLDDIAELPGADDDHLAALLDRTATDAAVVAAMRIAIERRDKGIITIITSWLDLADVLARPPSTREVAARVGVSHTTVAATLRRFRALLAEIS